MRSFIVRLSRGGGALFPSIESARLGFVDELNEEGKLVTSGNHSGIENDLLIVRAETIEEATRIAERDPAVERGGLDYQINEYLIEVNDLEEPGRS